MSANSNDTSKDRSLRTGDVVHYFQIADYASGLTPERSIVDIFFSCHRVMLH